MFVLVAVLAWPAAARADEVDKLIGQMSTGSTYKVRLSAALNLAKLGNKRAIPAFIKSLNDSDKTVRGVAAASLGKLVNSATPADTRNRALAALKASASKDSNAFVRKQAQKAYDVLKMIKPGGGAGPSLASGSIFVNIGGMSATTANSGTIKAVMKSQAEKTFRAKAAKMVLAGPSGPPSAATIKAKNVKAFHVEGTVNEIKVKGGVVECKVSLLIATYPDKSMFGFLKGGGGVEAGGDDADRAGEECVAAVIDDMIAKKIIPTILARAGN